MVRVVVGVSAAISSRQRSSEMHQAVVYFAMKEIFREAWTSVAIRQAHEFGPDGSYQGTGGRLRFKVVTGR